MKRLTCLFLALGMMLCACAEAPAVPLETTLPATTAPSTEMTLPPETTGQLCTALVPEIGNFSMTFGESKAIVSIQDGALSTVTLTAAGEVPFLVTTIPLSFHAELNIP